jgi:2',3'-cyclic-nucleotide 2'-phosphodiesterase/3'-nucleotidase/5'-nucleotidase
MRFTCAALLGLSVAVTTGCTKEDPSNDFNLQFQSRIHTGIFDDSAAEIVAYDKTNQRLFVVNGSDKAIDVYDVSNVAAPSKVGAIDTTAATANAAGPNSVSVSNGIVAVAIENSDKQAAGFVALYNASDLLLQNTVTVGWLPDMLTFTPDGKKIIVANEGEPNDAYDNDPEGTIAIIDLSAGVASATATVLDFNDFDSDIDDLRAANVRIFGPGASVSQDLEPEYIAINNEGDTAWVVLQENNAIAKLDLEDGEIDQIYPLGFKDHSAAGNELDVSDKDGTINLQNWPIFGMYQPDSIAHYAVDGVSYIVTANEGDARDYDGFSEEERVKDLDLDDAQFFPNEASLQANENLGRLAVTSASGDLDGDGDHDVLLSYGGRSFSIFKADDMSLVYDSGNDFETIISEQFPNQFGFSNDDHDADDFDSRSDAKGPEPEALAVANLGNKTYAFIGMERVGGIMVYDITSPAKPTFVTYQLDRDFAVDADTEEAGDLGPEGMIVIKAADSPNGQDLLVVANEVSGTTTLYSINNP